MNNSTGLWMTFGVCCVWPILFYLFVTYGLPAIIRYLTARDWKNIQWQNLWRKEE